TPPMILATLPFPFFPGAVAFDRTTAAQHHLRIFFLAAARHDRGHVLERLLVGEEQLGEEVDVAAEGDHAVPGARENCLLLLLAHRPAVEIRALVRLEISTVPGLHQRHAEHVEVIALPRALRVEDGRSRDVVVGGWLAQLHSASGCFEAWARSKASS